MIPGILFVIGLIGLWFGTNMVVKSADGIAERFKLSHAFMGLAILAVGTDLPEVFVTLDAAFLQLNGTESSGIITGNAIGSSICNISIVLGIAGLAMNYTIAKKDLIRDGSALLLSIVLIFILGFDGVITRVDGFILFSAYIFYYILLLKTHKYTSDENIKVVQTSKFKLALYLLVGFVVLIFCSHLVVKNAMYFAEKWGVTQTFVGIVLIGLGTSLPELAVSIAAAMRKSTGMFLGNIMGSNIINTLVLMGLGGSITPVSVEKNLIKFDIPVLFAMSVIVIFFLSTKKGISKKESIIIMAIYLLYVFAKIFYF